ncbi:MAG: hypothetical protein GQ570_05120 [Helicobacteraceae bacterium]|nr:hypothetical protein [Helicobacteraceae bacterium]
MEENINETRDLLIKEWFNNPSSELNRGNTILLLEDIFGTLEISLRNFLPKTSVVKQEEYKIFDMRTTMRYESIQNYQKAIVIIPADKNSEQFLNIDFNKLLRSSILHVPADHTDFYSNMAHYINSHTPNLNPITIPNNERYLHFIEKVNLHALLIQNRNLLWLNEYLNFMHDRFYRLCNQTNCISLLVKGTTFKETTYTTDVKNDINLFITANILTSRLVVLIYRVASLDPNANTTKIGRYFQSNSGSKSKVFSAKTHKALAYIPDLKGKSFKAYDLNVNEAEIAIRQEIAMNLLSLDINELDAKVIAKVTGYPKGGLKT